MSVRGRKADLAAPGGREPVGGFDALAAGQRQAHGQTLGQ